MRSPSQAVRRGLEDSKGPSTTPSDLERRTAPAGGGDHEVGAREAKAEDGSGPARGAVPVGPIGPSLPQSLEEEASTRGVGGAEDVEDDEDDEVGPQPEWMRQARRPTVEAMEAAEARRKRDRGAPPTGWPACLAQGPKHAPPRCAVGEQERTRARAAPHGERRG